MKLLISSLLAIIILFLNPSCTGSGNYGNKGAENETTSVSDTAFTGIKRFMSRGHLSMEIKFKNGVKNGLTKAYYLDGKLCGTLWYENGLLEDTSRWYFEEGQLFRTTPYTRDTIDGIQTQYFRNGKLKARLSYKKGLRTFEFEEFDVEGKRISGYPELIVNLKDDYTSKGIYSISLRLSDDSVQVKYFRGDFGKGVFDSAHCEKIETINGIGILDLKKTGRPQAGSVEILAAILTMYQNRYLVHKKIELPYKDLN
jgi:hypothetical protein